ncbi:hypothetical protein D3C81_1104620 [compost metagenome]
MAHVGHGFPVVAQLLIQAGEHGGVLDIVPAPRRGQVGAAWQAKVAAVGVTAQGVAHTLEVITLMAGAKEQQGVVAGVQLERHVVQVALLVVVVDEVVLVLQHPHIAPAQPAIHTQRAGYIELAAVVVPAAGRGQGLDLRLRQRAFVAEVDHAPWLACAVQAIGAAQQTDAVELSQVLIAAAVEHAGGGTAFVAHIVDLEATRYVSVLSPRLLAGDAGHLVHHLVHVAQLLVLQALVGDDGHRLGDFAQLLRAFAAHGGGARRVAAGVFRRGAQPLAFDIGGGQFEGLRGYVAAVLGSLLCREFQGFGAYHAGWQRSSEAEVKMQRQRRQPCGTGFGHELYIQVVIIVGCELFTNDLRFQYADENIFTSHDERAGRAVQYDHQVVSFDH